MIIVLRTLICWIFTRNISRASQGAGHQWRQHGGRLLHLRDEAVQARHHEVPERDDEVHHQQEVHKPGHDQQQQGPSQAHPQYGQLLWWGQCQGIRWESRWFWLPHWEAFRDIIYRFPGKIPQPTFTFLLLISSLQIIQFKFHSVQSEGLQSPRLLVSKILLLLGIIFTGDWKRAGLWRKWPTLLRQSLRKCQQHLQEILEAAEARVPGPSEADHSHGSRLLQLHGVLGPGR